MNNSKHIRIIFLLAALIAVLTIIPANAQVVELWNTTYEGSYDDTAQGVDTDSDNNVIITGTSNDGSTDNYYTIKYDSDGNEIWNATYDGGYQDVAWDVAADNGDNVTVTGFSNDSSTNNYYTIKYDKDGNEIWNATYDSGGADRARGVATDSDNNIVVTGITYDGVTDDKIYTIKYDPNGNELWNVTYDDDFDDRGYSIATDNDNNVIVTGESGDGSTYNYFTIKYDQDGNELWNVTYDGGKEDRAFGVDTDSLNNIIITGYSISPSNNWDYYTVKYNPDGDELWNATYNSSNFDSANDVATDSSDNIIVTGQSQSGFSFNYYTIKYDKDGNELWNVTYNSSFMDSAKGVATDKDNNVLVTGFKNSEAEKNNYYTIKYAEKNPSIDIEKYTCVDKIPCLQELEVIDGSPICFEKGIGVRYRSLGNTGADEIYLGVGNLGDGSNRAQKNFGSTNWGSQNSIVFKYDPIEDKLNTTVDIGNDSTIDYTLEYPNVASNVADKTGCNISNLDRMEILVANRDTDTTVNFTNVTFNGNELGNFVGEGASIWHVIGYNFSQGFTLKGNIELSGTFSASQELSRVEILVGCPGNDCGGYCYDADETTGPYTYVGDEVNWKYVVTNTGDVNLSDVIVNDSVEGTLTLVSGDTNGNGILDTTETWHYNTNGTAIQGQYSNIGNVTATAQYIDGVTINVNDEDKSHYFGANPAIDIEKYTNGQDADEPRGPAVQIGSQVTWTYNVTNIGNVELKDIEVTDSKLGDICSNDTLNPGDTLTCTITGNSEKGQHSNTASVTAVYDEIDCEGIEINDTDQSHYFGYDHWAGVPTTNPLLLVGVLGIAMLLFIRREQNK